MTSSWNWWRLGFAVTSLALFGLSACDSDSSGENEAQLAYNACTASYNDKFRGLTGNKAIVSGLDGSQTRCFWTWDRPSVEAAIESAMANCQAKMPKCYVYATNRGNSPWAQQIANNGGTVPNDYRPDGGGGSGGGTRRYACRVDPIANYVLKVPENSCSVRDLSRQDCDAVEGAFGFKDNGTFTECFFRPS